MSCLHAVMEDCHIVHSALILNIMTNRIIGHSVVNYTVSEDYTRITEFKYLTGQQADGTTIVKEYPFAYSGAEGEIPYYAILNEENQSLYENIKH